MLRRSGIRLLQLPRQQMQSMFARALTTIPIATKKSGVDLFFGNLPLDLTAGKLKHHIRMKFDGDFTGPRIVFNREEKKSLGYGYITVNTLEIANTAADVLKGLEIDGKVLKVDITKEKRTIRTAYFGNLATGVTEEELAAAVGAKYGKENVVSVHLAKDNEGRIRGFGHVELSSNELRDKCISEMNGMELRGNKLKVDKAVVKSRLPVVCINNISYDVTQQNLEEMFDDLVGHGNYLDVKMHFDRITGYPRGFAHVTFVSKKYANAALEELKGIEMLGRPLRAQLVDKKNKVKGGDKKVKGGVDSDQNNTTADTAVADTTAAADTTVSDSNDAKDEKSV